jgi:hypothetical protein
MTGSVMSGELGSLLLLLLILLLGSSSSPPQRRADMSIRRAVMGLRKGVESRETLSEEVIKVNRFVITIDHTHTTLDLL